MSLSWVTRDEALNLTRPWLDEATPHPLMGHVPGWNDLRPLLREAVADLMELPADGSAAARLAVELAADDREHDRAARVIDRILSGHAELGPDADARARYERLRELVLPDGLGANTQISWAEEAGRAIVRDRVLTEEVRGQLRGVPVAGGNLETVAQRMQTFATSIGEKLSRRDAAGQPIVTPERMRAARLRWARIVRHVLEAVSLTSPAILTAGNKASIIDPFERAARTAAARARAAGEDDGDPVPVPTPGPTP